MTNAIPVARILARADALMARRDAPAVERLFKYWLQEAEQCSDLRGELTLRNELIGHYRKNGNRDAALKQVDAALRLLERLDLGRSPSAGTTLINAATALNAFGENESSLKLFERALTLCEGQSGVTPAQMGSLYNNMGLCLAALGQWRRAEACYQRALDCMRASPRGALEEAITLLNCADLRALRDGPEASEKDIDALLEQALGLLTQKDAPEDGYYAFVCEKCAPTFDHYGWFADAEALRQIAQSFYERT